MKKTILFGVAGIMMATGANAGFFDGLFGSKDTEPKTLEEACNKDEITAICPEILLGTKTIQECVLENVSSVSKKCVKFIKKTATEKVESVKAQVAGVADSANAQTEEQKQAIAEQKAAAKEAKANLKKSLSETKEAAKALIKAEKAQITDAVSTDTVAE